MLYRRGEVLCIMEVFSSLFLQKSDMMKNKKLWYMGLKVSEPDRATAGEQFPQRSNARYACGWPPSRAPCYDFRLRTTPPTRLSSSEQAPTTARPRCTPFYRGLLSNRASSPNNPTLGSWSDKRAPPRSADVIGEC